MIGHIPKKITYYIRSGDKNLPAFACDSDSKSMKVAGEKWVHNYGVWNTNTKKYDYNQQIQIYEENNTAQNGYKIVDLEVRSEGGRAYKVITPHGYKVDLREDVLLDTILCVGILKGGILNGKYLWSQVGSQNKLVRLDSFLYKEILESAKRAKIEKVSKKDLESGRIYENVKGEKFVFMGRVNNAHVYRKHSGGCSNQYGYGAICDCDLSAYKDNMQLWMCLPSYDLNWKNFSTQLEWSKYIGDHYFFIDTIKDKKVIPTNDHIGVEFNFEEIKEKLMDYAKRNLDRGPSIAEMKKKISWEIIK